MHIKLLYISPMIYVIDTKAWLQNTAQNLSRSL